MKRKIKAVKNREKIEPIKSINTTGATEAAPYPRSDGIHEVNREIGRANPNKPSLDKVVDAKDWVDNGSRL